jgi:hypothetical protein
MISRSIIAGITDPTRPSLDMYYMLMAKTTMTRTKQNTVGEGRIQENE